MIDDDGERVKRSKVLLFCIRASGEESRRRGPARERQRRVLLAVAAAGLPGGGWGGGGGGGGLCGCVWGRTVWAFKHPKPSKCAKRQKLGHLGLWNTPRRNRTSEPGGGGDPDRNSEHTPRPARAGSEKRKARLMVMRVRCSPPVLNSVDLTPRAATSDVPLSSKKITL